MQSSNWSFRFCFGESISTYRDLQKINSCLVYSCIDARELWKEWRVACSVHGITAVEVKYLSSKSSISLCITLSILFLCFGKTEQRFRTERDTIKCWTIDYLWSDCCQWPSWSILWFVYIPVVCWEHSTTVCGPMAGRAHLQLAQPPPTHIPIPL